MREREKIDLDSSWLERMEQTFDNAAKCCSSDVDQKIAHQITAGKYWSQKITQMDKEKELKASEEQDHNTDVAYSTYREAGKMQDLNHTPIIVGGMSRLYTPQCNMSLLQE